jgi:NAD(P)-dependent dehydrogenase (short-subunit alcohol dehydrogenase family)
MAAIDLGKLYSVAGKTVLITGGVGGIGRMLSGAFVAAGARVYVSGRKPEALAEAVAALRADGEAHGIQADLATPDGVAALVAGITARESRLDVLINNAGQTWGAPFGQFPSKAWAPVMTVNVQTPFELAQALLPLLTAAASEASPARILNIGSVYGETTDVMKAYSYTASKAAIHQLTRVLAHDLAARRILVNAIAPGLFPSKMTDFVLRNDTAREALLQAIPLGRAGTPEDIAGLAMFLCSRAGSYITGAVIPIDGGILVAH